MIPYTKENGLRDYRPQIANEPSSCWRWGWYLIAVGLWAGFAYLVLTSRGAH